MAIVRPRPTLQPMPADRFEQSSLKRASGLRLSVALLLVAAIPTIAGCEVEVGLPGQVGFRGTLTVLNRTTAEVTVEGEETRFGVPACDEVTRENFPVNWWTVTSSGRDTFHPGGGNSAAHSYVLVTSVVTQQDERPDPLPSCEGLLQPAQH
jgi:hypothetical protein